LEFIYKLEFTLLIALIYIIICIIYYS